jgi:hypothetical protein
MRTLMRIHIEATLAVLIIGHSAGAQRTTPVPAGVASGPSASAAADAAAVMTFRRGLQVSLDGTTWTQSLTVDLPPSRCVPATSSPCAAGTAPLYVKIKFAGLPSPADAATVLRQLGMTPSGGAHYFVFPVPMNAAGTPAGVCEGGFSSPNAVTPSNNVHIGLVLDRPGAPLPVTCSWVVVAGIPRPGSATGVDLIWSDTVSVRAVAKP